MASKLKAGDLVWSRYGMPPTDKFYARLVRKNGGIWYFDYITREGNLVRNAQSSVRYLNRMTEADILEAKLKGEVLS